MTCSCYSVVTKYLFKKTYAAADSNIVISDIYEQCSLYHLKETPINNWIVNEYSSDTSQFVQRMIRHEESKKEIYDFIYSKIIYPHKTYYEFKIRYTGKRK